MLSAEGGGLGSTLVKRGKFGKSFENLENSVLDRQRLYKIKFSN